MKIEIIKGDITKIEVDAIVNAANTSLLGGGGVDGAIHGAGGPEILEDCQKIRNAQGKCKVGNAVITRAGKLPAKHVIHTVGPHWNGGSNKESIKLESCYEKSIELAIENNCRTIAFPCISTGIYRFPKEQAAEIAVKTIKLHKNQDAIDRIIIVCFDDENYQLYQQLI
ncbi:MAG: O-acetyl-ADP-ribose deacetylase [Crocinitomicaceae bacterium]|nr:O-acetyl-ADP-ribose deacetylase [Crocinitomicaceae bacterium]